MGSHGLHPLDVALSHSSPRLELSVPHAYRAAVLARIRCHPSDWLHAVTWREVFAQYVRLSRHVHVNLDLGPRGERKRVETSYCRIFVASWMVLSRLYIISEAVFSLRFLPKDVYQTIDWTLYIPHI